MSGSEISADGSSVDVVIVSYNSSRSLRQAVEPLLQEPDVHVIVVDNASRDDSVETAASLEVQTIRLEQNFGFAYGCNRGWEAGSSPYVLFLNPDAVLQPVDLRRLVATLEADASVGLAAPKIVDENGSTDFSIRRFPRLRSAYGQALFLHRLFPRARWVDEVVRDPTVYETPTSVEWISGACMLVPRTLLERIGGWDEGFFLYCEDIDLCKRIGEAGFEIRYEPSSVAVHQGGASGFRPGLLPTLAQSRLRYTRKHRNAGWQFFERVGFALGALTHVMVSRGGLAARRGHARSLAVMAFGKPSAQP